MRNGFKPDVVLRSFLSEKEKPLHAIIARGTRIYSTQSKGTPLVHVRDMLKIISLPVFRNADRRSIAISVIQALESGLVPMSSQAPMHLDESGVSMVLKASRLSKLLLRDPLHSTLTIEVSYIEAMYAPALRQKLLRRKRKLSKLRLADAFFIKRHGPPLFKHWKFLWRGKKRLVAALTRIERKITLAYSDMCLQHWRRFLLQTKSAVRVQAAFRGFRVRMAFFRASQAQFIAVQIGKLYYWKTKGRHEAQRKVLEDLASVQIQRIARGVVCRKRVVMKYITTDNPPFICLKLKLLRDGNLERHAEALTIQCAYRCFCAMRLADQLWSARHEEEQRAEREEARMKAEHTKDLAAIRVVERMVEQRLKERLEHDKAIAAAMRAANDVSTLRSKRKHEEKKRQIEVEAENLRKRQAQALLEVNAEWDEKLTQATSKEREKWEKIIFFKRPEDGTDEDRRLWDSSKSEYMDIAKKLTAKRRNALEQNVVDAKNMFIDVKLKDITTDISKQRAAARKKVAADLAGKLDSFREERAIATSSGEAAATKTICEFILRCQQRSAIRSLIRESWRKDYDLLAGEYQYINDKAKLVSKAKPMLLGNTDVPIQDRWVVVQGNYEGRELVYFFNARTHTLSWTQPEFTVMCPRCSAAFVEYTCSEGCGDMCSGCWSDAHPSSDSELAVHAWTQKLGGRPIHTLDQYDSTSIYLAGALGDSDVLQDLTSEQSKQYVSRETFASAQPESDVGGVDKAGQDAYGLRPESDTFVDGAAAGGIYHDEQQAQEGYYEEQQAQEGYYDEDGGYVWPNGGYTTADGEYYPPE